MDTVQGYTLCNWSILHFFLITPVSSGHASAINFKSHVFKVVFYYSNWFCHMTFLSAVWLLNTWIWPFICMCIFIRDWVLNLMMLFIQWKFHEACRQFASVNWISFVDILCRYLFKMMNIYAIDSEFEVKLWCTNTIPCSQSVLLLLLFLFLCLNKSCNYVTLVYM